MAIGDVYKMWSRSDGGVSSKDGRKYTARFKDGWTVDHDPGEPKATILNATGLPELGDAFESSAWVFCTDKNIVESTPVLTTLEVLYEGEVGPGGVDDSPINDPPEITWENIVSVEETDEDGEGVALATALGEPVEGLTRPISDFQLTVKRNFLFLDMPNIAQYLQSVNNDTFQGFAPGTAHLEKFTAHPVWNKTQTTLFWEVDSKILFRTPYNTTAEKAWWHRYLHQGYRYKKANGAVVNIIEDEQANLTKPVMLDDDGTLSLTPGPIIVPVGKWKEQPKFPFKLSYNALGLL